MGRPHRPTASPPNGNVPAPINVGTTDQVKNAGLGVNSIAVFGNAILSGVGRYFNFGPTSGTSGYGIRDNVGILEFKNNGGSWASIQSTVATLCAGGACGGGSGPWATSGNNIYNTNTANVGIGTAAPGYKLTVAGDIYANGDWLRTSGNAGWYNESYGGGWYMQDSTWIRSYNSKPVYMSAGFDTGTPSGVGCGGALGGGYTFRVCGSAQVTSGLYTNILYDSDNAGYYVDPSGTSNINSLQASALYRTYGFNGPEYDANNAGYYVDPNGTSRMGNVYPDSIYNYGNSNVNDEYIRSIGLWVSQLRLSQQLGPVYLSDSSLICNNANGVVVGMSTPNFPNGGILMYCRNIYY